jgi:hypothetical protein
VRKKCRSSRRGPLDRACLITMVTWQHLADAPVGPLVWPTARRDGSTSSSRTYDPVRSHSRLPLIFWYVLLTWAGLMWRMVMQAFSPPHTSMEVWGRTEVGAGNDANKHATPSLLRNHTLETGCQWVQGSSWHSNSWYAHISNRGAGADPQSEMHRMR